LAVSGSGFEAPAFVSGFDDVSVVGEAIEGQWRAPQNMLFQVALAAACHNPVLTPTAQLVKERGSQTSLSSSQSQADSNRKRGPQSGHRMAV
jgi:DNA-binding FadR family transcriptional regulator